LWPTAAADRLTVAPSHDLDAVARANQKHWRELAAAGQSYTRPWLDLDVAQLHRFRLGEEPGTSGPLFQMHPAHLLRDVAGKQVLCLASGGGQQSAVFGLLGAHVTILDLTEAQLQADRHAADRYGYEIATVLGDMRDLSQLSTAAFDLVYQAPSLGWVPDVRQVYRGVERVLRPGGRYRVHVVNPANAAMEWDGESFVITQPYAVREFRQASGALNFRHSMGDLFNGLLECGLQVEEVLDHPWGAADPTAAPGSWAHEMAYNVALILVARAV
jgi:SAM-dependent methyltransferase